MKPAKSFTVYPKLPEELSDLNKLAYNLRWTWNNNTRSLFSRMDMNLWEEVNHDPVALLNRIDQKTLNELANDDSYLYSLRSVMEEFEQYKETEPWFHGKNEYSEDLNIGYFSMEFGLTESMAIYSGGLGVLSGDHLKSSSEIGIPLVGIGLAYKKGYFSQHFTINGWQEEKYPYNDFYNWPMEILKDDEGNRKIISVDFPGRKVYAQVWVAKVGRIPLYLLDTNIDKNSPEDREITFGLYHGGDELRISQEILLGMGGAKLLEQEVSPKSIIHMNEGHSAFAGLQRIKSLMKVADLTFFEAMRTIKASSVFTTHTPVKAGIDKFSPDLVSKYFEDYCNEVGIDSSTLLNLGRIDSKKEDKFSMAILAINLSQKTNGVSELHGEVSRNLWQSLWPNALTEEIPIDSVTNGIHQPSWISHEMSELFNRYVGPSWREEPASSKTWAKVKEIPDGELWRVHETRRTRLVEVSRKILAQYYRNIGRPEREIRKAKSVLDTDALTIGFARRFATYKRGTLIFRDQQRLKEILTDKDKPVQIIISGKAHPHDQPGKELIKNIIKLSEQEEFRNHVVFLPDYDMNIARYLVEGCDIWLNTPRRPKEACGTSGMKAAANGGINFSTLDGWWDEAYNNKIGWAIGDGEEWEDYEDLEEWDHNESNDIYRLLEEQIVPMFYDRGPDRIPRDWVELMKNSMAEICPQYNTNRMLKEYTLNYYVEAHEKSKLLRKNNFQKTKELNKWQNNLEDLWDEIRFIDIEYNSPKKMKIDSQLKVDCQVYLGDIKPDDIDVEIYYGKLNAEGKLEDGNIKKMEVESELGDGKYQFHVKVSNWKSGLNGFTLRMVPSKDALAETDKQKLIFWLES